MKKSNLTLKAAELRKLSDENREKASKVERNNIWVVLDRVYDAYNVGNAARLVDAVNGKGIVLVGEDITADENHPQVKRSSVFTSELIEWRKAKTLFDVGCLFPSKLSIIVEKIESALLEYEAKSYGLYDTASLKGKVVASLAENVPILVTVGNETTGIRDENWILMSNFILEIPVYGINNSLNVRSALSIALYKMLGFI